MHRGTFRSVIGIQWGQISRLVAAAIDGTDGVCLICCIGRKSLNGPFSVTSRIIFIRIKVGLRCITMCSLVDVYEDAVKRCTVDVVAAIDRTLDGGISCDIRCAAI